jgi:DNA polymerase III alpha subunit (gram-positive type)
MGEIVFFDLETAGLKPEHAIIQIGAVAVDSSWKELEVFEQKIQFDPALAEPQALEVNHYSLDAWAASAVPELTALRSFKAFLERHRTVKMISLRSGKPYTVARVAGHNIIGFDLERIARAFKRHGDFLPVQFSGALDTLQGAVWFFASHPKMQEPKNFKLETLVEYFEIESSGAHEALVDVRITIELAKRLLLEVKK